MTHNELPVQYQIPQAMHAAMEFAKENPLEFKDWHAKSNSLIVLAAKTERELYDFSLKLEKKGIKFARFYEPDVGYMLTSIAILPSDDTKKLCSCFGLAGKAQPAIVVERMENLWNTVDKMLNCQQTSNINMLQHGLSVRNHLFDLLDNETENLSFEWRLPDWFLNNRAKILKNMADRFTLGRYTVMHDCGKPDSLIINKESGLRSYPDHARISKETWLSFSDDKLIAEFIGRDMDIHLLRPSELQEWLTSLEKDIKEKQLKISLKDFCVSLLVVALAEIHSNAMMFGGLQSDSFKIKWKKIDKLGNLICNQLIA